MNELHDMCDPEACNDNAHFQALIIKIQYLLDLDDGDCADLFDVNRSSINRWRHGKAMPMPLVRCVVCRVIRRMVSGEVTR